MEKENNSRIGFLKTLGWTLAAVFGFGLIKQKTSGTRFQKRDQINLLSLDEANEYLRNMKSATRKIKPEPPPKVN